MAGAPILGKVLGGPLGRLQSISSQSLGHPSPKRPADSSLLNRLHQSIPGLVAVETQFGELPQGGQLQFGRAKESASLGPGKAQALIPCGPNGSGDVRSGRPNRPPTTAAKPGPLLAWGATSTGDSEENRGKRRWCQGGESNSRPRAYESPALPLSYPGTDSNQKGTASSRPATVQAMPGLGQALFDSLPLIGEPRSNGRVSIPPPPPGWSTPQSDQSPPSPRRQASGTPGASARSQPRAASRSK